MAMLRVLACLTQDHHPGLVLLAAIVCLGAAFTAMSLIPRAASASGPLRVAWLAATAMVTGGGVWATHFIAMLAFRPGLPLGYDLSLTILSVAIAIVVTGLGFAVATVAPGPRSRVAAAGGAVVGVGVFSMHYTGMAALRVPAVIDYDETLVVASLIIGVAFGALAVSRAVAADDFRTRLVSAGLLTLAICGLHFTAMGAAVLIPDPTVVVPEQAIPPDGLAVAIAVVTMLMLGTGLAGSIADQRFAAHTAREAQRLRRTVAELVQTKHRLEATARDLSAALEAAAAGSQAKSQFLAAMSHELRTPLNAVIGFAELLHDEACGPLNDEQRQYLADVRHAGAHLLALVNDVLDLSKLDAARLELNEEELDLPEVIASTLSMVAHRAEDHGLTLARTIASDLPRLRADRLRLRQVLLNLLSNAIKFTPSGGEVRIHAHRHGGGVAIVIADTGVGIAAADIPKALERFGQVDSSLTRRHEGTGLGLPLAKQLMEVHGGTLEIDSEVGVGTAVTISFPPYRAVAARQAA